MVLFLQMKTLILLRGGLAIVAIVRQLPRGFFFENARHFFKNAWHFKDIFREFEAFFKVILGFFKKFDSF
jgi:hypothetical protein